MGTAQILTPISELLWVILIWQALWGFGYTFQSGADTAWVTDEIGEEDDSLVMSKAAAMAVGVIFGILTAMVLTRWSVTGAVSASGVVALMFAAWLAVRMPETNFTPVDRSQRSAGAAMLDTWRRGFGLVRRVRVTRILIIATVIVSMVNELVDRLDFLRMRELGFPELDGASSTALFGAVWIFMILLELPIMIYFSRRSEVPTDRRSALLMVSMFALAALGIAFMATNFFILALLGWVMRDVFREVVEPVGEAWFNRYAESDIRATVISFRTQSMAFGEIFGGLCLGLVAEILSVQLAFVAGAALMSLAVVQVGRLLRVETPA
jgi:predicted MFS family arabinose efflux permease